MNALEAYLKHKTAREAGGGTTASPLPSDGPLLSLDDVAAYLRTTPAAVRKLLDGRPDSDDGALGAALRRFVVRLSVHRRHIARQPFLAWLNAHVGQVPHNEAS